MSTSPNESNAVNQIDNTDSNDLNRKISHEDVTSGDQDNNNTKLGQSGSVDNLNDALNSVQIDNVSGSSSDEGDDGHEYMELADVQHQPNEFDLQLYTQRAQEETALNRGLELLYHNILLY